jgi:hypothetical protein
LVNLFPDTEFANRYSVDALANQPAECFNTAGGFKMDILKALRREEKKIEKHAKSAAKNLETVRASIEVFAGSVDRKRRKMSKAARAKISAAQKSRWAKWAKSQTK